MFRSVATKIVQQVVPLINTINKFVGLQTKIKTSTEKPNEINLGPIKVSKTKNKTKTLNKEKKVNLYTTNTDSVGANVKSGNMTTSLDISTRDISLSSGNDNIQTSVGFNYDGLDSTVFISGTYNYNIEDSVTYRIDVDLKFVLFGYAWSKVNNLSKLIPAFTY